MVLLFWNERGVSTEKKTKVEVTHVVESENSRANRHFRLAEIMYLQRSLS